MTDRHTNALHPLGAAFRDVASARRAAAWMREEVRYHLALRELRRLDDRDLDDLDLGRGDLPGLARRHARGEVVMPRHG